MKIKGFLLCIVVMAMGIYLCGPCRAAGWILDGCSDYEMSTVSFRYAADPNASVGLIAMTDSDIVGRHVMIGPVAQFNLGPVYSAALDTILPKTWSASIQNTANMIQMRPFGRLAAAWDIGSLDGTGEDNGNKYCGDLMFLAGTGTEFFVDWPVRPFIFTGYFRPEGSAPESQQIRTMFGVKYEF